MPTRDEDWHRLIDGDDPDDPLESSASQLADCWLVFEAFVNMDSAKAAHDAIALADELTVRRALLAGVIGRRGTALSDDERAEWMRGDATLGDLLRLTDFPRRSE